MVLLKPMWLVPALFLYLSGSQVPSLVHWKLISVVTLDIPTSRWMGLAGRQHVDRKVTCQREPLHVSPPEFWASLQPTGREMTEPDLLKYNSRLIL